MSRRHQLFQSLVHPVGCRNRVPTSTSCHAREWPLTGRPSPPSARWRVSKSKFLSAPRAIAVKSWILGIEMSPRLAPALCSNNLKIVPLCFLKNPCFHSNSVHDLATIPVDLSVEAGRPPGVRKSRRTDNFAEACRQRRGSRSAISSKVSELERDRCFGSFVGNIPFYCQTLF